MSIKTHEGNSGKQPHEGYSDEVNKPHEGNGKFAHGFPGQNLLGKKAHGPCGVADDEHGEEYDVFGHMNDTAITIKGAWKPYEGQHEGDRENGPTQMRIATTGASSSHLPHAMEREKEGFPGRREITPMKGL